MEMSAAESRMKVTIFSVSSLPLTKYFVPLFSDATLTVGMTGSDADGEEVDAGEEFGADEDEIGADEEKIGADEGKFGADEEKIGADGEEDDANASRRDLMEDDGCCIGLHCTTMGRASRDDVHSEDGEESSVFTVVTVTVSFPAMLCPSNRHACSNAAFSLLLSDGAWLHRMLKWPPFAFTLLRQK